MIPSTAYAADVQAIADLLAATPVGDVCAYARLSAAIGRDVTRCRYLALSAIRRLNKDTGALFASVRGVGYQRLPADDAHKVGSTARARIRRAARHASVAIGRAMDCANDMTPEARRRAVVEVGTLNLMAHLSTERSVANADTGADKPQPVAVTMAAALKAMGVKVEAA